MLKEQGISVSKKTLKRALQGWGIRRQTAQEATQEIVEQIRVEFHTTLASDMLQAWKVCRVTWSNRKPGL